MITFHQFQIFLTLNLCLKVLFLFLARVRRKPLSDRTTTAKPGRGAGTCGGADQDLVSKQASQDQEGFRTAQSPRTATHGTRPVQPQYCAPDERRRRIRDEG